MKPAIVISRFILGLGFVVFGLNILHPFLPQPAIPDGSLPARFMGVMGPSRWMALAGLFHMLGGVFFLIGRAGPPRAQVFGPLGTEIFGFHISLFGGGGAVAGVQCSLL